MGDEKGDSGAGAGTVRCACGAVVSVPPESMGREQTCAACGVTFKAVWALDPKTHERVLTRVAAKGNAIRIPPGSHQLNCTCGQVLVARKDQAGKKVKCPVCGASMVIERYKDPQTLETKVRRARGKLPETLRNETPLIAPTPPGPTTPPPHS